MHSLIAKLLISFATLVSALQPFSTWQHQRIQLADTSIHFRYSDSGKPPLLLIGPVLAEQYTVIAPDNRGCGESDLSTSDNYTAPAAAGDLLAILNFLNISKVNVASHDKGVGIAMALAFENPDRIERLAVIEYALPGSGFYTTTVGSPDAYRNWQLAFFAVPEAAQFFIQGREREMLLWYFWHGSYSGNDVISNELLDVYTRSISKLGFLRAGMMYFAAAFWEEQYFGRLLNETGKLQMPVLAMAGEASGGVMGFAEGAFGPYAEQLETDIIPKAGHWIGDENPLWTANRLLEFFNTTDNLPSVDLSVLDSLITMFGAFGGGMLTPGINGTS